LEKKRFIAIQGVKERKIELRAEQEEEKKQVE
jgi:hypothetical protein